MATRKLTEVKKESEHKDSRFDRIPSCSECGMDMEKNPEGEGNTFICPNCGSKSGKS
jgi:predicted RNA-binding Zn-ribbon protein involved in translation (DUF1610 family)